MATKILIEFDNTRAKGGAKGLAEAAKLFEKAGLKPVDYSVEEKTKRSAGRSYKRVFFNFEDAQRVEMWVTYDKKAPIKGGDIFKVKLGGAGVAESIRATELPITNQDDHAEAIEEIVKALQSNEKKFQAKLAKIKVELPPDLTTSKVKKIELLENRIKELDEAIEMAGKELAALHDPNHGAVASESPVEAVEPQAAQVEMPLRSSAEIRQELDALSAKDKAYNRLQNEGGEGYYRDSIPESLRNEYMAALDREFREKWTKEYFEKVRGEWNAIVAEKSNGGKIALTRKDLESVERRVGENSQDIAKARTMLGIKPPTPQDAKNVLESAKPKIEVKNYSGTNQILVNGEIAHVFGGRSIEEEIAKLDRDNVTLYGKKAEENRRIRGMLNGLIAK